MTKFSAAEYGGGRGPSTCGRSLCERLTACRMTFLIGMLVSRFIAIPKNGIACGDEPQILRLQKRRTQDGKSYFYFLETKSGECEETIAGSRDTVRWRQAFSKEAGRAGGGGVSGKGGEPGVSSVEALGRERSL